MSALEARLLSPIADFPLVRRVLEALLAARCRRHLARLDRFPAVRAQLRTLLNLIHQARATPFGHDHDFNRIRCIADYQRLVPLHERTVWYRLTSDRELVDPERQTPLLVDQLDRPLRLTPELIQAHRRAIRTAFALALRAQPRVRLLDGRILWLGDDTRLLFSGAYTAQQLVQARFPLTIHHVVEDASAGDPATLARQWLDRPLTAIVGSAKRLDALLQQACHQRGESSLRRLWPQLRVLVRLRTDALTAALPAEAEGIQTIDLLTYPEAPLGVSDPSYPQMRLLVEHGVFFEFVPLDQADELHPPRWVLDQVQPETAYEVVLTAPAGIWARRTGLVVTFDQLEPPLFRILTEPATSAARRLPLPSRTEPLRPADSTPPKPVPLPNRLHRPDSGVSVSRLLLL